MALYGKLETDVEVNASVEKFHEIFHQKLHHMSNISPDKIQSIELHEGEWGKVGTIFYWHYFHGLFIYISMGSKLLVFFNRLWVNL